MHALLASVTGGIFALIYTIVSVNAESARSADIGLGNAASNLAGSTVEVTVPQFWNIRQRLEKPFLAPQRVWRVLTDDTYPPLHFTSGEGNLTGLSVELMRSVCETLEITCTIQARRFDTLLNVLEQGQGDVVAAAIPVTSDLRHKFLATHIYHKMPARFLVRKDWQAWPMSVSALSGRTVATVAGSAHEAFMKAYMPKVERRSYSDLPSAADALKRADIDFLFGDGTTLSTWLTTPQGEGCALIGKSYLDATFFGEGIAFIVRPEDETLRKAIDYALQQLAEKGTYADLYLRFFPYGIY